MGRDALGRRAVARQRLGHGGMPREALAGHEILVERGPHDRVHEPEAVVASEDVGPDEIVGRIAGDVDAEPRDLCGEAKLAVVAEHGDGTRKLARGRPEPRKPVQHEPADGRRPDGVDLARGDARGLDAGGLERPQQLLEEQRVAAGRDVACTTELLGRARSEALPGELEDSRPRSAGEGTARQPRVARPPPPRGPPLARTEWSGARPASSIAPEARRSAARGRRGIATNRGRPTGSRRPTISSGGPVGEVDDQPVQAVERLEGDVACERSRLVGFEQPRRWSRRGGE